MSRLDFPCGTCKYLRRKCNQGCIFAPYFCNEAESTEFKTIHKVFGAKNALNLLSHLPVSDHDKPIATIVYKAQARIPDLTYGCVYEILALQQQV